MLTGNFQSEMNYFELLRAVMLRQGANRGRERKRGGEKSRAAVARRPQCQV